MEFEPLIRSLGRKTVLRIYLILRCTAMVNGLWIGSPGTIAEAQGLVPIAPQDRDAVNQHRFLNSTDNSVMKVHKGPTGKACITVIGDARPQAVNPQIYNHLVIATNTCGQNIKLKVCYYQSDHCVSVNVSPHSDKEAMLGIMPSMKTFRFEYRELFNPFGPN